MKNQKTPRKSRGWRLGALLLLTGMLLGGAAGLFVGTRMAESYTAQATVLVAPLQGNPYSPNGNGQDLVNLETEAQLAASDAVAEAVAEDVRAPDAGRLLDGLTVDVPPNTQIVELTYTARQPLAAEKRAQGFATAYLDFRTDRATNVVDGQAATIQDEIDNRSIELNALLEEKSDIVDPVQRSIIQEQIDGATKQIGKLRTSITGVRTINADPGTVISPARIVSRDPQTTRLLFAGAGAIAGLAAAALLVVSRARTTGSRDSLPDSFTIPDAIEPMERTAVQRQNA